MGHNAHWVKIQDIAIDLTEIIYINNYDYKTSGGTSYRIHLWTLGKEYFTIYTNSLKERNDLWVFLEENLKNIHSFYEYKPPEPEPEPEPKKPEPKKRPGNSYKSDLTYYFEKIDGGAL